MSERQEYEAQEQTIRLLKELVEIERANNRILIRLLTTLEEAEPEPAEGFEITQTS
jgi:hypothetical protein